MKKKRKAENHTKYKILWRRTFLNSLVKKGVSLDTQNLPFFIFQPKGEQKKRKKLCKNSSFFDSWKFHNSHMNCLKKFKVTPASRTQKPLQISLIFILFSGRGIPYGSASQAKHSFHYYTMDEHEHNYSVSISMSYSIKASGYN